MTKDVRRGISRELSAARLRPDRAYFDYVGARLYHMGELEYERLLERTGSELEHQAKPAVRLLGFGHVMTEFAVAHLGFPGKPAPALLSLGALSNLIVTIYDGLLDSGQDGERVLPRSRLTGPRRRKNKTGDPLVNRLVDLYFAGVASLPRPDARVHKTLRSAILRMYDAERATSGSLEYTAAVWRRKSALPLVIMGLPVWMTVPSFDRRAYRAHLKWLYRLGRFFGWIDDAADLDDDRAAGRSNFFSAGLNRGMARRIAREGALILEAWNAGAPNGGYSRTLRETFLAVTWSWLGTRQSRDRKGAI